VGTLAIGKPGAANAALLAAEILALTDAALCDRLALWRAREPRKCWTRSCRSERRPRILHFFPIGSSLALVYRNDTLAACTKTFT